MPDIEGITNPEKESYFCGEGPYENTLGRWIGGLGMCLAMRSDYPSHLDAMKDFRTATMML